MSVCSVISKTACTNFGLSVCMSVCSVISKTACTNFGKLSDHVPVAVVYCSCDDNAICYALPVLWMTQLFHIMFHIHTNTIHHKLPIYLLGGVACCLIQSSLTYSGNKLHTSSKVCYPSFIRFTHFTQQNTAFVIETVDIFHDNSC